MADRKLRDFAVIATKFTFNGASRKIPTPAATAAKISTARSKARLRRLKTDYIDLYYLHAWDIVTPVEEVVSTLTDLVREGKIRYYGFSDTPAWYVARAQTIAEKEGKERIATLQLEYSLVERNIEREHVPASQELGIGICPWSPLAGGFLSGKYKRDGNTFQGEGRFEKLRAAKNPMLRNSQRPALECSRCGLRCCEKDRQNSRASGFELGRYAGRASLPRFWAPRSFSQLEDNLGAVEFTIPTELRKQLDDGQRTRIGSSLHFFLGRIRSMISGGTSLAPWAPAQVYPRSQAGAMPSPDARAKAAER